MYVICVRKILEVKCVVNLFFAERNTKNKSQLNEIDEL